MTGIEIVLDSVSVAAYLNERQKSLPEVLGAKMDLINAHFVEAVRGNLSGAVLNPITGRLRDSVQQIPAQIAGDEIYGSVTAGGEAAPYGIYFEEGGTREYIIVPVEARVLAFMMEGHMIFTQKVIHPPTPHLPWFGPEIPDAEDAMATAIKEGFKEVFGE